MDEYEPIKNDGRAKDIAIPNRAADIKDNPEAGFNRASNYIMTLERSSQVISLSKDHFFTVAELEFAAGQPGPPSPKVLCDAALIEPEVLASFAPQMRKSWLGNGMDLSVQCAVWLYVMSNLVPRDVLTKFDPLMLFECEGLRMRKRARLVPSTRNRTSLLEDEEDL